MAERPPPPPLPADRGNGAKTWIPKSKSKSKSKSNPKGSIPIPTSTPAVAGAGYGCMSPPPKSLFATGYGPYGAAGACFAGVGPYGYGYQHVGTALPQFLPQQPQVNVNGFVENRDLEMGFVQGQTIVPAIVRRGTGVFHSPRPPLPIPYNNKTNKNIGKRNKQGAGVIHQTKSSRNASEGNDGLMKQEESHQRAPSSEISLPKEWPY